MPNVLSSLMVTLGADTAAFQQDLGRASQVARTEFEKIMDTAKNMAVALGGAFAIDAMKDAVLQAVDYADAISDMSQRVGQSVETLTAMGYAAQFSGSSIDTYAAGVEKLNNNMVSAAEGNASAVKMFGKLGVSVEDSSGKLRDSGAVLLDVADKIAAMKSPAEKTAVVMDIFGKAAGPELLQMMNQGKKGIIDLTDEAQKMGVVMKTEAAEAAGKLKDNIDKLSLKAKGATQSFTSGLIPALVDVSKHMLGASTSAEGMERAGAGLGSVISTIYYGVAGLSIVLAKAADGFGKLIAMDVAAFIEHDLDSVARIWNDNSARDKATKDLQELRDWYEQVGKSAADAGKSMADASDKAGTGCAGGPPAASGLPLKGEKGAKGGGAGDLEKAQQGGIDAAFLEYSQKIDAERAFQAELLKIQKKDEAGLAAAELEKQAGIDAAFNDYSLKLDAEKAYQDQVSNLRQKALDDEKNMREMAVSFAQNALSRIGQSSHTAAKVAEGIGKAQALARIYQATPVAAMNAASAVAGIPVIGPGLAMAAKVAMYAMGAAEAAAVLSGGKASSPSSSGSISIPSGSGAGSVQPISQQQPERVQQTILQLPANGLMTGRMIADLLDYALGDGKQLTNLRVQLT
jgi:hypothetical protein